MVANEKWFGASAGFYPETIDQSVRFNDGDSPQLYKTFGTPTSNTKMIYATWFKTTENNSHQTFFSGGSNSNNYFVFALSTDSFYNTADSLFFSLNTGNVGRLRLFTNTTYGQFFADTTNWQHMLLAIDTTQATNTNRILIFHNGKKLIDFSSTIYPSQDYSVPLLNTAIAHNFGFNKQSTTYGSFDGYFAETYFLDGQSLFSDTSGTINSTFLADANTLAMFCERKNGIGIPKTYSSTFGNNGVKLTYADSSNIGDDTSGNGNDFTSSGLVSSDIVLDSPTNNFATFNVFTGHSATVMSQGNLSARANNSSNVLESQSSTIGVTSGKWYAEFRADDLVNDGQNNGTQIGVTTVPYNRGSGNQNGYIVGNTRVNLDQNTGAYLGVDQDLTQNNIGTYADGDIIGVALDVDNSQVSFYKNGSAITNATNASINVQNALHFFEIQVRKYDGDTSQITANFGQDSTFAGAVSAGGNTDGNGIGDFKYSVPSGYLALCSANLTTGAISPDSTTQVDDHHKTVTYSGNGSNNHQITDVGFQPDWLWIKVTSTAGSHYLVDSTRHLGTGDSMRVLQTNGTNAEYTTENDQVRSFDINGFTLDDNTDDTWYVNRNSDTYVAWNWKAGGATPTKTYKVKVVADSTDYGHGTGSNKYQFLKSDGSTGFGTNGVDLDLQEGGTYVFDWSDSSAQSHPIRFSLTNDGTHSNGTSAGSEYTTGVVKDDSNYLTTITVASGVASLYYYCQNHSGMGAEVRTNESHGSTNFDGTILSVVQTNETAGFSILKYTGTGVAGTIGHGLGKTPALLLTKNISWTHEYSAWLQWHHKRENAFNASTNYAYMNLSSTGGTSTTSFYRGDQINTTTYGIYTNDAINDASYEYICYAFTEIAGYSKFGSYEGNGTTDNAFVYCGFRPTYLLIKNGDASANWVIRDEKNSGYDPYDGNPILIGLDAETNLGYQGSNNFRVDFISNGFKIRSSQTDLGASNTYYFWAFGNDFKFSNAR